MFVKTRIIEVDELTVILFVIRCKSCCRHDTFDTNFLTSSKRTGCSIVKSNNILAIKYNFLAFQSSHQRKQPLFSSVITSAITRALCCVQVLLVAFEHDDLMLFECSELCVRAFIYFWLSIRSHHRHKISLLLLARLQLRCSFHCMSRWT